MNKTRMLVVIAVVAVVGTLAWTLINRPKPSVRSESDAERDQSMRAAFTTTVGRGDAKDVTGDAELVAEITEFFKALGTAFDEGDRSKLKNLVSGEMMIDYAQRSGVLDLSSLGPMRQVSFRRQFTNGLLQGLATHGKNNAFTRPRVVRVEQISKREVLAYMRSQSVWLGVETKSRWWLLKNLAGEWQAYDWEDLDSGIRTSTLMGAMAGPNTSAPWNQDALNLLQAVQQLQASEEFDPTQLREPCEKLLAHKVPAVIESLARGLLAAALLTLGVIPGHPLHRLRGGYPQEIQAIGDHLAHGLTQCQPCIPQGLVFYQHLVGVVPGVKIPCQLAQVGGDSMGLAPAGSAGHHFRVAVQSSQQRGLVFVAQAVQLPQRRFPVPVPAQFRQSPQHTAGPGVGVLYIVDRVVVAL